MGLNVTAIEVNVCIHLAYGITCKLLYAVLPINFFEITVNNCSITMLKIAYVYEGCTAKI